MYGILAIRSGLSAFGASKKLAKNDDGRTLTFENQQDANNQAAAYNKGATFVSYLAVPIEHNGCRWVEKEQD